MISSEESDVENSSSPMIHSQVESEEDSSDHESKKPIKKKKRASKKSLRPRKRPRSSRKRTSNKERGKKHSMSSIMSLATHEALVTMGYGSLLDGDIVVGALSQIMPRRLGFYTTPMELFVYLSGQAVRRVLVSFVANHSDTWDGTYSDLERRATESAPWIGRLLDEYASIMNNETSAPSHAISILADIVDSGGGSDPIIPKNKLYSAVSSVSEWDSRLFEPAQKLARKIIVSMFIMFVVIKIAIAKDDPMEIEDIYTLICPKESTEKSHKTKIILPRHVIGILHSMALPSDIIVDTVHVIKDLIEVSEYKCKDIFDDEFVYHLTPHKSYKPVKKTKLTKVRKHFSKQSSENIKTLSTQTSSNPLYLVKTVKSRSCTMFNNMCLNMGTLDKDNESSSVRYADLCGTTVQDVIVNFKQTESMEYTTKREVSRFITHLKNVIKLFVFSLGKSGYTIPERYFAAFEYVTGIRSYFSDMEGRHNVVKEMNEAYDSILSLKSKARGIKKRLDAMSRAKANMSSKGEIHNSTVRVISALIPNADEDYIKKNKKDCILKIEAEMERVSEEDKAISEEMKTNKAEKDYLYFIKVTELANYLSITIPNTSNKIRISSTKHPIINTIRKLYICLTAEKVDNMFSSILSERYTPQQISHRYIETLTRPAYEIPLSLSGYVGSNAQDINTVLWGVLQNMDIPSIIDNVPKQFVSNGLNRIYLMKNNSFKHSAIPKIIESGGHRGLDEIMNGATNKSAVEHMSRLGIEASEEEFDDVLYTEDPYINVNMKYLVGNEKIVFFMHEVIRRLVAALTSEDYVLPLVSNKKKQSIQELKKTMPTITKEREVEGENGEKKTESYSTLKYDMIQSIFNDVIKDKTNLTDIVRNCTNVEFLSSYKNNITNHKSITHKIIKMLRIVLYPKSQDEIKYYIPPMISEAIHELSGWKVLFFPNKKFFMSDKSKAKKETTENSLGYVKASKEHADPFVIPSYFTAPKKMEEKAKDYVVYRTIYIHKTLIRK